MLYVSRLETGFAFAKAMRIKKVFVGKNIIYKRRKIEKSKLSKAHSLFSKYHKRRRKGASGESIRSLLIRYELRALRHSGMLITSLYDSGTVVA